jgi:hypothetical protein
MAGTGETEVDFDRLKRESDTKEDLSSAMSTCSATVGGAGAVAVAGLPGSSTALGASAACGVIGAFLVGNSEGVSKNAEQLRAANGTYAATLDENTKAAGRLGDEDGEGSDSYRYSA